MRHIIYSILLASLPITFVGTVYAAPQKFSKCKEKIKVRTPQKHGGYFFDESCEGIYVLPPRSGKVYIDAIAPSVTKEQCQVVESLQKGFLDDAKTIEELKKQNNNQSRSASVQKVKELNSIKAKHRKVSAQLPMLLKIVNQLNKQKESFEESITVLTLEVEGCDSCHSQKRRLAKSKRGLAKIVDKSLPKSEAALSLFQGKADSYQQEISLLEEEILQIKGENSESAEEITLREEELDEDIAGHAENFGTKEGAVFTMIFENTHQDLVDEFKKKNPHLDVNAMPVKMRLAANLKIAGESTEVPAVLSSKIAGFPEQKKNSQEDGVIEPNDNEVSSEDLEKEMKFGNSLQGQVILTKAAACPLLKSTNWGKRINSASRGFTAHIAANAFYEYPVQVGRSYKATYNHGKLVSKILSKKKKTRLFKSTTVDSLSKSSKSEEWITITSISEDQSLDLTEDQKVEIRREFIDRALQKVATAFVPYNLATSKTGPTGATIAAKELRTKCLHAYCQVAAIALDVANGLFGGSESVSKYIESTSVEQTETVTEKKMVKLNGSLAFEAR